MMQNKVLHLTSRHEGPLAGELFVSVRRIFERIRMTQDHGLYEKLSPEYAGRIEAIKSHVALNVYNTSSKAAFYSYTDHYMGHAERLVQIANNLIPKESYKDFNSIEIFILYCAIYLHDIGMVVSRNTDIAPEQIRQSHGSLASSYIHEHHHGLALTLAESNVIAIICEAHNRSDLSNVPELTIVGPWGIRVSFLTALLRLLDVLDIDYARVPSVALLSMSIPPRIQEQWRANRAISDVIFNPLDATIVLRIALELDNNPDQLLHIIERLAAKIEKYLKELSHLLEPNGVVYRQVIFDIEGSHTSFRGVKKRIEDSYVGSE